MTAPLISTKVLFFKPAASLMPVRAEAIRLVDDYVALIDQWLRHRMTNLEDWSERVRVAAST